MPPPPPPAHGTAVTLLGPSRAMFVQLQKNWSSSSWIAEKSHLKLPRSIVGGLPRVQVRDATDADLFHEEAGGGGNQCTGRGTSMAPLCFLPLMAMGVRQGQAMRAASRAGGVE
jgi:hypothetical protein